MHFLAKIEKHTFTPKPQDAFFRKKKRKTHISIKTHFSAKPVKPHFSTKTEKSHFPVKTKKNAFSSQNKNQVFPPKL